MRPSSISEITLKPNVLALSVLTSLVLAASQAGAATNMFDPTVSTANKINANAVTLNGTLHDTNGNTQPWTTQVYAQAGECMRLAVTSAFGVDVKMEVIAPDGLVYRDDDSNGNLLPLVKIDGTPNFGWYTVQIAHFNGVPQTGIDFVLKYGRYNLGNPNCANGTAPLSEPGGAQQAAKDKNVMLPAQPRNPYAP